MGSQRADRCAGPSGGETPAPFPVAWLSLDESDNDLGRFLTYFIAALRGIDDSIGIEIQTALQASQTPQVEILMTMLINEVAGIESRFALVLDDYHVIKAQPIQRATTFLLDHMPLQMHLIIASRDDPFLPLPRLRARGQMIEIRAADLRFSPPETATFLNQVMDLGLSGDDVTALESRTEGWIAGLHLAALSMQSRQQSGQDPSSFISALTGDDRYILDYLVDEVLARQPKGTAGFLLQTSILDRMTGPLCDAVCQTNGEGSDRPSGTEMLNALERANLFIVPLDNQRRWYRYHHLFADVLRQRLCESTPAQDIGALHQRASQWYEENGFRTEPVEHALAAGNYEEAIRLIWRCAPEMFARSQLTRLSTWWAQLPQQLITARPKLCMMYAWVWLATGHPQKAERCLRAVEQTLGADVTELQAGTDGSPPLATAVRVALVEVAVVRAQLVIGRGDFSEALRLSLLVLPDLEDDEGPYLYNHPKDSRMVTLFVTGVARKCRGELGAALRALTAAAILAQEQRNVHLVAVAHGHRADVQATRGRLRRAAQTCQQGLRLLQEMAGRRSPASGLLHTELGKLQYEHNDLEAALRSLQEGITLAKPWSLWETLVPGYTGLARLRAAQGNWGDAFAALDELARLGQGNPDAVMRAVESFRARFSAAQGDLDAAGRWAQTAGLDVDGEISFLGEPEYIILARVLIAQGAWDKAGRLVARLLEMAQTGERWARVIELLVLQTLITARIRQQDGAFAALSRALALAEPEGYVRTFVDAGPPMAQLLYQAAERGIAPDYAGRLIAAFPHPEHGAPLPASVSRSESPLHVVEPLSKREVEVLQLIAAGLSNKEIARELYLSTGTIKVHAHNIYGKLGVTGRTQAVARARSLSIIPND